MSKPDPVKCPYCKKDITTLNKSVEPFEEYLCWVDEFGNYQEKQVTYEPEDTVYSCPECFHHLDFTHSEDATKFLKGEPIE